MNTAQRAGRQILAATLFCVVLHVAGDAAATVVGDFESNWDGWSREGFAQRPGSWLGIDPTLGSRMARLRTDENGTRSPSSDTQLENALGLAIGTIDALSPSGNDATVGSAMYLVLDVNAGDEFVYDYNLVTRESLADAVTYRDFFFSTFHSTSEDSTVVVDDVLTMSRLATSNANWVQSGWQEMRYTFQTSGQFTIGFGVTDVADEEFGTRVLLDHLRHIPEPGTGVLVSLGLVAIGVRRRSLSAPAARASASGSA